MYLGFKVQNISIGILYLMAAGNQTSLMRLVKVTSLALTISFSSSITSYPFSPPRPDGGAS